jgi:hypothetical protein
MGEERARYRRPLKFVPGVEKAVRTLPAGRATAKAAAATLRSAPVQKRGKQN